MTVIIQKIEKKILKGRPAYVVAEFNKLAKPVILQSSVSDSKNISLLVEYDSAATRSNSDAKLVVCAATKDSVLNFINNTENFTLKGFFDLGRKIMTLGTTQKLAVFLIEQISGFLVEGIVDNVAGTIAEVTPDYNAEIRLTTVVPFANDTDKSLSIDFLVDSDSPETFFDLSFDLNYQNSFTIYRGARLTKINNKFIVDGDLIPLSALESSGFHSLTSIIIRRQSYSQTKFNLITFSVV